jgi:hypothetical protein
MFYISSSVYHTTVNGLIPVAKGNTVECAVQGNVYFVYPKAKE